MYIKTSSPAASRVVIEVVGCVSADSGSSLCDHVAAVIARAPAHIDFDLGAVSAIDDDGWRFVATAVRMIAHRRR